MEGIKSSEENNYMNIIARQINENERTIAEIRSKYTEDLTRRRIEGDTDRKSLGQIVDGDQLAQLKQLWVDHVALERGHPHGTLCS